ncbi:MAG: beta-lactamase/transpeptidase-like protein [Podila humilis]|nr:MAG: beta-lactamase/transpeptidase-like protein [Podila humilis]
MVKPLLILTVALVLQCATITYAGEPDSAVRDFDTILAKLKIEIEQARNHTGVPGMGVAIMHKGKLIFAEGFGKRNKNDPFTPETRSMIGSLTKAFTATTVGELVADGKMDWDSTPVNTYLPEFETIDPVLTSQLTMRDLLSHRTPFPSLDYNWFWANETRRDLIKRIRHVPVNPKLRSATNYNNVMYSVAGEAAANAAGMPIEKLVRNRIFRPLGLTNTGFTMEEMSKNPNHALPYKAASFEDAVAGRFIELPLDGAIEKDAAAGDMYASVLDLARWGQVVMKEGLHNGKQMLSKEGIAVTLTAHTIMDPVIRDPDFALSSQYGMGWYFDTYKGNNLYRHSGRVFGYITDLTIFPNAELVVAVLTNSDLTALTNYVKLQVADKILGLRKSHDWLTHDAIAATAALYNVMDDISKGNFPKQVPNKPPAHDLDEYAGEYSHPGFGTFAVQLEKDELHVSYEAFTGVLTHYHFESFTTVLCHAPAMSMGELLTFQTGADGRVSGLSTEAVGSQAHFAKRQVKYSHVTQLSPEYHARDSQTVMMARRQQPLTHLHALIQ